MESTFIYCKIADSPKIARMNVVVVVLPGKLMLFMQLYYLIHHSQVGAFMHYDVADDGLCLFRSTIQLFKIAFTGIFHSVMCYFTLICAHRWCLDGLNVPKKHAMQVFERNQLDVHRRVQRKMVFPKQTEINTHNGTKKKTSVKIIRRPHLCRYFTYELHHSREIDCFINSFYCCCFFSC